MQMRLRADFVRTFVGNKNILRAKKVSNFGNFLTFNFTSDGVTAGPRIVDNTVTGAAVGLFPPNGQDFIYYAHITDTGDVAYALGTPDGTVFLEGTFPAVGGTYAILTSAGSGEILLSGSQSSIEGPHEVDSLAIFGAPRTGNSRFAKPLTTDSDVVSLYYFAEGAGTAAADSKVGGAAMSLANISWVASDVDSWNEGLTPPTVASYSPSTAPVGQVVTITGTNFTGATGATIGGLALTSFTVVNFTTITGVIPAGAATNPIIVASPGGSGTGPSLTVYTPVYTSLRVSDPNTSYETGALLLPITVTKLDQNGNPTSLGPTTVTAAEILPGRSVSGTLTRSFVGPTATFNDLVITAGGGAPGDGEGGPPPSRAPNLARNAERAQMRGQLSKVLDILSKNSPKRR